jgi:hypothetical protein
MSSSKSRLQNAINHKEVKIPIDFGSNAVTGMHVSVVAALRDYYGLEKRPVKVNEPFQMLGEVDEELKQVLKIDVDGFYPYGTIFGFPNEGWKEWRTPWGQEVLVPKNFQVTADDQNNQYIYPQGDTSVPPSGKMPNNGFFFDSIIRQKPIVEEELDPADNLEEFGPISDAELDYYRRAAAELKSSSRGICANFGGTGLGDIALVPGPFMKHPKGIRDVTEWYISTVSRRDYLHEVFSKQTDTALENLAKIHDAVGDLPDAMFICGTDFGTQTSTFCSIDTYRDLYKPYYQKVTGWIHANTGWKVFKHSCGSVIDFVEEFIESGFDILNPVQLSAAGMDPVDLKKRFGGRIVFWGGGVDTQKTLPFGKPEEVREEVLRRCENFAPGGGYVFNAIHNVQAKSPVENVAAMIEAVHEFNGEK